MCNYEEYTSYALISIPINKSIPKKHQRQKIPANQLSNAEPGLVHTRTDDVRHMTHACYYTYSHICDAF